MPLDANDPLTLKEASRRNRCRRLHRSTQHHDMPPTEPAALPPKPIASKAPRGVDQAEWDKADDRGRKRLVQRARG